MQSSADCTYAPIMRIRIRSLAQEPSLVHAMRRLHGKAWPDFLRDDAVNALWPALYTVFPDFQIGLFDARNRVVAIGNAIPFVWDGRGSTLPDRIVDVLARGLADQRAGRRPTTLSALAAIVDRRHQGQGLSARVIAGMREIARIRAFRALVAPVRPNLKGRYPLVSMKRYIRWRHPDGGPFDPWLRVHWRLGARVLRITPRGNTVRATVAQWEARTGLVFPESGRYIVPDAFHPVRVDRTRDRVHYEEANVWMRHSPC